MNRVDVPRVNNLRSGPIVIASRSTLANRISPHKAKRSVANDSYPGISGDDNNDLSEAAFVLDRSGVGEWGLIEWHRGVDEAFEGSCVDESAYFEELLLPGFD